MPSKITARQCLTASAALLMLAACSDYADDSGDSDVGSVTNAIRGGHGHGHDHDRGDGHHGHGHDRGHGHHGKGKHHGWGKHDDHGECAAAAVDGKVGLCHAGDDGYEYIEVSVKGCAHGHSRHEDDFISDDPTCGASCEPVVCDETLCGVMPDGCDGEIDCGPCPMPNLTPTAMCGRTSVEVGALLAVDFSIDNNGTDSAPAGVVGSFYLSTDPDISSADVLLGDFIDEPLMAAGDSWASSAGLVIPAGTAAGTYYIGVIADSAGVLGELDESDNVLAYCGVLTVTSGGGPRR